ncbi:hypothetical protein ACFHW2_02575 [Actinomadura sp. LOL_016]|uniref:hypothetical protein n=1 Tax=Actinomadura sp. LOL_016 TaxID=3345411 RepID=UPI003A863E8D
MSCGVRPDERGRVPATSPGRGRTRRTFVTFANTRTVQDGLYARYYGIDRRALDAWRFRDLCRTRAGATGGWSVPGNGMIIEQAQILTTHNLAVLVHPIGADPLDGWDGLARRAFGTACRLVRKVEGNPRPLGTIKDAAYAWRQALFFLSLCGLKEQVAVAAWMQDELDRQPAHVVRRLDPVLAGLRHVLVGGTFDDAPPSARGACSAGRWAPTGCAAPERRDSKTSTGFECTRAAARRDARSPLRAPACGDRRSPSRTPGSPVPRALIGGSERRARRAVRNPWFVGPRWKCGTR